MKLADTLPSKTVPTKRRFTSSKRKGKQPRAKKRLRPTVQVDGLDNEAPLRRDSESLHDKRQIKKVYLFLLLLIASQTFFFF